VCIGVDVDNSQNGITNGEDVISDYSPQQIHLSYSGDPNSMYVTFATNVMSEVQGSVTFWRSGEDSSVAVTKEAARSVMNHTDGDDYNDTRLTYIFRATMTQLEPDTEYSYYVTSGTKQSAVFKFKTFPATDSQTIPSFTTTFAIYGDLGVENHVSLPKLIQDVDDGVYDMVMHLGGFAYDMDENNGVQGDIFMNMIQPIATRVPYMTTVGSHDSYHNFTEYKGRFTTPPSSVFYYSFNCGPIHFILFSSEFYFYDQYGTGQLQAQYNWLVEDLAKANKPENRNAQPWIVAMAHRPMYCSSNDGDDCTKHDSIMRTGYEHWQYKLEDLFWQNGVDLQIYAHEHNYERLYPIYKYGYQKVKNDSIYHNVRYPIHIISGSAGCREMHDPFVFPKPKWSVVRSDNYGFGLLTVEEKLRLKFKQFSIDQGQFIDDLTISKESIYPNFDYYPH